MDRREAVKAGVMAVGVVALGGCSDGPPRELVGPFGDTVGHPYAKSIEAIRLAGLTAGVGGDPPRYEPDRPLTRGEVAVMLARLLELR